MHMSHHCSGPHLDVMIADDFNCHDQLWGGHEVAPRRQGNEDPIADFMSRWSLQSPLPYGAGTWHDRRHASTIALILASQGLARSTTRSTDLTILK